MRILHALSQRPGRTGSGIFLQQLIKAANKKGHNQAALVGVPKGEVFHLKEELDVQEIYPVVFESAQLPFAVAGMSDVMPYESTKFSDFDTKMLEAYTDAFKKIIVQAVDTFEPDVILSNHLWLLSSFLIDMYPDKKVMCLCHGTDLRQIQLSPKLYLHVNKHLCKAERIFALNEAQKEIIVKKYGCLEDRVIVSGSGYDEKMFYPLQKPKPKPLEVVYVGKMSDAKGVPELISAFENLGELSQKAHLRLIGGGSGKESEAIFESIKESKNIEYLGFVEQDFLVKTFQESHLFVLPSYFEGLPLVVIEALASGMRVVVTRLPGLQEFLGDEIEQMGMITYVDLPQMESVDRPLKSEKVDFSKRLSKAISQQIEAILEDESIDTEHLQKQLQNKTWMGLFERLEKFFD